MYILFLLHLDSCGFLAHRNETSRWDRESTPIATRFIDSRKVNAHAYRDWLCFQIRSRAKYRCVLFIDIRIRLLRWSWTGGRIRSTTKLAIDDRVDVIVPLPTCANKCRVDKINGQCDAFSYLARTCPYGRFTRIGHRCLGHVHLCAARWTTLQISDMLRMRFPLEDVRFRLERCDSIIYHRLRVLRKAR